MHLGNSIICPITGIPTLLAMGGAVFYAFKGVQKDCNKDKFISFIILTCLVFALQMINFSIPTTGSSGHIIGAMLLCVLFGRNLAFLSMSVILLVQALFFNDGGLMAYGCNLFNMGFLACFVVYPYIYKLFEKNNRKFVGLILSSIIALQLGSIAITIEALLSGSIVSSYGMFLGLMQGIHLPIGIVEGFISTLVVLAVDKIKNSSYIFGVLALILGSFVSEYASNKPDGLEWSLLNMSESFVEQTSGQIYNISQLIQQKTAILTSATPVLNIIGIALCAAFISILYSLTLRKTNI